MAATLPHHSSSSVPQVTQLKVTTALSCWGGFGVKYGIKGTFQINPVTFSLAVVEKGGRRELGKMLVLHKN